jgi:flagellar biosynthesis GTPase FlhF
MDLKKQILDALGLSNEEEVQLGFQAKLTDGTIVVSKDDKLEEGSPIEVLSTDGTTMPLPVGDYEIEDGRTFKVEKEGFIAVIGAEEAWQEVDEEDEAIEDAKEEMTDEKDDVELAEEDKEEDYEEESPAEKADWAYTYELLKDRVDKMEEEIKVLKGEATKENMEEETVEETTEDRSNTPKTIKTTEVVEFTKEDVDKLKAENESLKKELAEKPADTQLNVNKFSAQDSWYGQSKMTDTSKMSKRDRILNNIINNKN